MLPAYYRFKARNDGGVSGTVTVKWQPYKVLAGGITYGPEATQINISIASAAISTGGAIDNTGDKYHGGFVSFSVNPGSTPTGNQTWLLFLEKSNDNTSFGTVEEQVVGSLLLTATGVQVGVYEVRF